MNCPKCETEGMIFSTENVMKDGKLFFRKYFCCRNKRCSDYQAQFGSEDTELEFKVEDTE